MCGICGYVGIDDAELVYRMAERLTHRGPDDDGFLHDGNVHLGFRRLSVIDLSGGAQPMSTDDGALTIVYNGEVYNFKEIRENLESRGHKFRTQSDTEVVLRLFQDKGHAALRELNGMFAFAIYDRRRQELFLARDRIGIKPLYYLALPGRLLFASEAKALHCYREWTPTVDPTAIRSYLALRYVPGRKAMFNEIKRLPPGHYLTYRNGEVRIERYWSLPEARVEKPRPEEDYVDELGEILERSVRRRLVSDVSLGAYLSGGLDSSVVVGLMSKMSSSPVKTFSVGFDYEHDELTDAAALAARLGCDHHELACRASDVALLPDVVYHTDEPLGDAIAIPMFQLSREAKKQVTVILTGEGGDELFAGYLFHKVMWAGDIFRRAVPESVRRRLVLPLLSMAPANLLNIAFSYPAYLGERGKQKALDYLRLLDPSMMQKAYEHLISLFDHREESDMFTDEFRSQLRDGNREDELEAPAGSDGSPYLDRLLALQFLHWLPDNMLLRADKVSMAHGIEARVPFLDHELVEFSTRVPPRFKLRRLVGKYILRKFAGKLLPRDVVRRRKMPFYVPVEKYFKEPAFLDMMNELLSERAIRERGIFRPQAVTKLRTLMDEREFLPVKQVFSLMVLELWQRAFQDGGGAPSGLRKQ